MCNACDRTPRNDHPPERGRPADGGRSAQLSRRRLLRQAVAGAAAAATGPLWLPGITGAAAGDDTGTGEDGAAGRTSTVSQFSAPAGVVTTRQIPSPNLSGVAPPTIISRASWGADETIRVAHRAYAPIRKIVVHHTASSNRPSNPAEIVREVYQDHVLRRGFADIGYNFMIDHRGNIYEGRYSRRYGDEPITGEDHAGWGVVGAHAKTMNAGTCGICLIGNFDLASPTDAALSSLQWLVAWKAGRQRIDATDADPFVNVYGTWGEFGNIAGHRNVGGTACPGRSLYAFLPTLRQNVAGQAGRWDSLIADIPRLLRYEWTRDGQGPMSGQTTGSGSGSGSSSGTGGASGGTAGGTAGGVPGSGPSATSASAYRAVTDAGQVFTVGKAAKLGQPGRASGAVVAMANPGWGDGFFTLTAGGVVTAFGSLAALGDVSAKQDGSAIDLCVTPSGAGYWILMANGGIYPFGDARYFSSPKRAGIGVAPVRMAARPQGDGYWVLLADGTVRGFGAARSLGGPGVAAGAPVDLATTRSGSGYWVLLDTGEVAAFGDAPAKGGMASKNVRWAKPAAAIVRVGADGYVISARDGGLYTFNGAPYFGSFAGSGATVVSIAPAAT